MSGLGILINIISTISWQNNILMDKKQKTITLTKLSINLTNLLCIRKPNKTWYIHTSKIKLLGGIRKLTYAIVLSYTTQTLPYCPLTLLHKLRYNIHTLKNIKYYQTNTLTLAQVDEVAKSFSKNALPPWKME